jgi:uncharacterized protein (TIGR00730 family)
MIRISALCIIFFWYTQSCFAYQHVAVFCSADTKASAEFKSCAYILGQELYSNNFGLITGGSNTGLMKEVVDGYVSVGHDATHIYGILPLVLQKYQIQHPALLAERIEWVETIHIRLERFAQLADFVIVLPGGFGTLHELFDFLVHNQFGLIKTPIILLNINNFWGSVVAQCTTMVQQHLVTPDHFSLLTVVPSIPVCIETLTTHTATHDHEHLDNYYWQAK